MEAIITAVIAAISAIAVALIQQMRKENKADHGRVRDILSDLGETVRDVNKKLDHHIEWHLDKDSTKPLKPTRSRKKPSSE